MSAREALLRSVGAVVDDGAPIEHLVDNVGRILDVFLPGPEDRRMAVVRLQTVEHLAGSGQATTRALRTASMIAVRTLSSDVAVTLSDVGGIQMTNVDSGHTADVRADGSVYMSGLRMSVDEVVRRFSEQN